jgi:AcrR family transcriptional regulator
VSTRPYRSPLRERQAEQTRDLILDALTDLLETRRADEVVTRDLARRAGVSERTVYRHFPDRRALLAGLSDRLLDMTGSGPPGGLSSIDDLPRIAVELMARLDEVEGVARAEALLNADPRGFSPATGENTAQLRRAIADGLPELDERDQVRLAAVVRCLVSAQAWLRMREEFGVRGKDAGLTVGWVLETVFDAIRRGRGPNGTAPAPGTPKSSGRPRGSARRAPR